MPGEIKQEIRSSIGATRISRGTGKFKFAKFGLTECNSVVVRWRVSLMTHPGDGDCGDK